MMGERGLGCHSEEYGWQLIGPPRADFPRMSSDAGRLPDFIVLGAAKAGTTSLARWLADNPDVFVATDKELNFFSYDAVFARGVEWYARCFAAPTARVTGEASPSYLAAPQAPRRMAELVPDAKLLVLLRDPIERAQSHYWWNRNWGVEHRSFADAVRDEIAGRGDDTYLLVSRYIEHIRRYSEYFPRSSLSVLFFDDLNSNPAGVYRSVCKTLGVAADPVPESVGKVFNAAHRVRSRRLWRWAGRIAGGRSWRNSEALRGIDRLLAVRHTYFAPDPAVTSMLLEYFEEYDAALAAWLGVQALPWRRTPERPPSGLEGN